MTNGPMIVRSIGLSEETTEAWRQVGGWYPRRDRGINEMLQLFNSNSPDNFIINLGSTSFCPEPELLSLYGINQEKIYNHGDTIRPLVRPGTTRQLLGSLLPPYPRRNNAVAVRYWVKAPGAKGRGKALELGQKVPQVHPDWDLQTHVVGDEYRVITVNDKVVQVSHRKGPNGERVYNWIGVKAAPSVVKTTAKEAAGKLDGNTIIGWDIIHVPGMNKAFVLEGNSCPGVNYATAVRIVNQLLGRSYENA
jgi:hypothetical protein